MIYNIVLLSTLAVLALECRNHSVNTLVATMPTASIQGFRFELSGWIRS